MTTRRAIRQRLDELTARLPPRPIVHDLSRLDRVQLRRYGEHQTRLAAWKAAHPDPADWFAGLDDRNGIEPCPELQEDLRFILEGPRRTEPDDGLTLAERWDRLIAAQRVK